MQHMYMCASFCLCDHQKEKEIIWRWSIKMWLQCTCKRMKCVLNELFDDISKSTVCTCMGVNLIMVLAFLALRRNLTSLLSKLTSQVLHKPSSKLVAYCRCLHYSSMTESHLLVAQCTRVRNDVFSFGLEKGFVLLGKISFRWWYNYFPFPCSLPHFLSPFKQVLKWQVQGHVLIHPGAWATILNDFSRILWRQHGEATMYGNWRVFHKMKGWVRKWWPSLGEHTAYCGASGVQATTSSIRWGLTYSCETVIGSSLKQNTPSLWRDASEHSTSWIPSLRGEASATLLDPHQVWWISRSGLVDSSPWATTESPFQASMDQPLLFSLPLI